MGPGSSGPMNLMNTFCYHRPHLREIVLRLFTWATTPFGREQEVSLMQNLVVLTG
jgi:hypothetical protein